MKIKYVGIRNADDSLPKVLLNSGEFVQIEEAGLEVSQDEAAKLVATGNFVAVTTPAPAKAVAKNKAE
jgi:hypothetical protein